MKKGTWICKRGEMTFESLEYYENCMDLHKNAARKMVGLIVVLNILICHGCFVFVNNMDPVKTNQNRN